MEPRADGGGSGLELGPPRSEPLPYTHRLTRGSGLSGEAWPSVLTVPLKEGQMVEDPVPRRLVPSPRVEHEGQVSYLFPFLPRGANWALGSGISRKTLGRSEERCEPQTVRPRTYPPPSQAPRPLSTRARPPGPQQRHKSPSPAARAPPEQCHHPLVQGGPVRREQVRRRPGTRTWGYPASPLLTYPLPTVAFVTLENRP